MKQRAVIRLTALVGVAAALALAPTAVGGTSRACPEQQGGPCHQIGPRSGGDKRNKQRPMIKPLETRDSRGVPAWSSGGHVMQ
jgi:hypothetical protein